MKRQVQETGIRKWFGSDWIELQDELYTALDSFFQPYGNMVIKGCDVDGNDISPGIVALWGKDGENNDIYRVARFDGLQAASQFPVYLVLSITEEKRLYQTGGNKNIALVYKATHQYSVPSGEHLVITSQGAQRTFRDAIQSNAYRFTTDTEKTNWNGKLNASELVSSPSASKALRLNASSQFPATVIAQTSSHRFTTDTEKNNWNNAMQPGDFGLGAVQGLNLSGDFNNFLPSGIYRAFGNEANHPFIGFGVVFNGSYGEEYKSQLWSRISNEDDVHDLFYRYCGLIGGWRNWVRIFHTGNFTDNSSSWNAKLDGSEVVATAQANKVLRLNGSGEFPAAVIAQTSTRRFITDTERNNWNTAYGWGNHANAGYVPETRTLTGGDGINSLGNLSVNRTISITNIAAGSSSVGALRYNGTTRSAGRFYGGTTDPINSTRLNYDGHFMANWLVAKESIGSEGNVSSVGNTICGGYLLVGSGSTNRYIYFGSPSVNGSVRLRWFNESLRVERRENGSWVHKSYLS